MNSLKVLLFNIMLISPARAQNDSFIGKPCTIDGNMKGTCFYNTNGEISYWIVRPWRNPALGGGPEVALPETVGYPALQKEQQEYNRWAKSISPAPELVIDGLPPAAHTERHVENYHYGGPSTHGWEFTNPAIKIFIIPYNIAETGALNLDTLHIPMFMAAVEILASRSRLAKDCASASDILSGWNWAHTITRSGTADICTFMDLSESPEFSDWQNALNSRADTLTAAETSLRRFDALVGKLRHTLVEDDAQGFTQDRLPPGMTEQFLALKAASDAALRHSDSLEKENRNLEGKYRRLALEAVRRHEEKIHQDALEELDKEWFAKYGEHYHSGSN